MSSKLITASDEGVGMLELGAWLGRHQAFAAVANKCTAADAECLRKIRAGKLYRRLGLTWQQFCRQRAGVDRKTADQIIQRLEEFGESYFHVTSILAIGPAGYRAIAPAVFENALEFEGERIPIDPANAERLSFAVSALREQSRDTAPSDAPAESGAGEWEKLTELHNRIGRCLSELDGVMNGNLRELDQIAARGIVQHLEEWIGKRKRGS